LSYDSNIQSECKNALLDKSKDDKCFPSSGCRLRDTSLALLALDNINSNTEDIKNWLLSQTTIPDLEWYLEIDADEQTTCTITYSGTSYQTDIRENKKLTKGAGPCLTLSQSAYWLKISNNCIAVNYTISCDKDFITTLLYKKPNSDIWHVSSQTNSASASGQTQEKVDSKCFKQNNQCNYEGSLWATLALSKLGEDIDNYLPYLIAYSEDNEEFAPYSFLYILTVFNDYFTNIVNTQNTQGYWDLNSPYTNLYDTALNLLALQTTSSDQASNAKTWLLSIQSSDGCWNSVRDTAFILYAAWPKPAAQTSISQDNCQDYNNYCITTGECLESGGNILPNFYCPGVGKICCDKPATLKTCSERLGTICQTGETCDGTIVTSSDQGTCCIGTCLPFVEESECEQYSYTCKSLCSDNEEEKPYNCETGEICCGLKTERKSYWWIWLLIILIILLIIGIIFRDKIKLFIFKFKNKFKSGKPIGRRPPFPPTSPRTGIISRPIFRKPLPTHSIQRRQAKPSSNIDKELEDTLRKLREIGK